MDQLTRQKTVGAYSCPVLDLERVRIRHQFQQEQKKLEDMVADRFKRGHINMGADSGILKQSILLDRLIVNEMELNEPNSDHKDQH